MEDDNCGVCSECLPVEGLPPLGWLCEPYSGLRCAKETTQLQQVRDRLPLTLWRFVGSDCFHSMLRKEGLPSEA